MAITTAVFMCHAPIVLPEVGGARSQECAATTAAMRETARALVSHRPDVLLITSPHTPRLRRGWGVVSQARLTGDFSRFGAPRVRIDLPVAQQAVGDLVRCCEADGIQLSEIRLAALDHGAAVPLHFVVEAGWTGPTLLLNLPWESGEHAAMGRAIRAASVGQRWAVLASGDMSHKLIPGAPAGYDPRATGFDEAFSGALRAGDLRAAATVDPALREVAAEDAVDSLAVAAAAVDYDNHGHRFFSYEGPFGVGYCEAVLYSDGAPP